MNDGVNLIHINNGLNLNPYFFIKESNFFFKIIFSIKVTDIYIFNFGYKKELLIISFIFNIYIFRNPVHPNIL